MPASLSLSLEGQTVGVRMVDSTATTELKLSVDEALRLASHLLVLLKDVAERPKTGLLNQEPLLTSLNPSLAVGADPNGQLAVVLQTSSLPPIRYSLAEETAAVLLKAAQEILSIPASMRFQPDPH